MKTSDFDYHLPPERIAQRPLADRSASRLLHLERATGQITHTRFAEIGRYLRPGDVLVANNSRVIPARLYGIKAGTGGKVELLLLERLGGVTWKALAGGRRLTAGVIIKLLDRDGRESDLLAEVTAVLDGPQREIQFSRPVDELLADLGHTPLPPYIHEPLDDAGRYQTIYAQPPGSAAAPTAGLHFTPDLLIDLRRQGVLFETATLHVGLDTFKPVEAEIIHDHAMHSEWIQLTPEAARRINEAKLAGGRIIAVGTTSARTLETAALRSAGLMGSLQSVSRPDGEGYGLCPWRPVAAYEGPTDLFIHPGYQFRVVDGLITNFHLPQSTLMMMVSAFAGREQIMRAYQAALAEPYRFLSFGDAMLIQ
jgi:S-adenosylmethionine:tRNA ribosyltransferase-isomerase